MLQTEVLIIGGGPAGAACAWRLKQNNIDCLVLDQHPFPRFKPCAGWITPKVVKELGMNIAEYPHSFTTFDALHMSIRGLRFKLRTRQHAIRRYEFDHWLLARSCAPFQVHSVKNITQSPSGYIVDGQFSARFLVGAGGTYCPVYRTFFKSESPKEKETLIVAQEEEFAYPHASEGCQLWFLENRLPGYAWYVPKANGYINVGVGGKAAELNKNGDSLKNHWDFLVEKLERLGLVRDHAYHPTAHSYYLRQRPRSSRAPGIRKDNAFLVGDSAGLATLDMGEGISAAIKSGLLAAESILTGVEYTTAAIPRLSLFPHVVMESLLSPFHRA